MIHKAWKVCGVLLLAAVSGRADSGGTPTAEQILDQFVAATGGKANYAKLKNRVLTGTLEVTTVGVKGTIKIYQAAPNKMYTETDLPGVGRIITGTDGKVAWETSPITGARIKEGTEKALALRRANFNNDVEWRQQYKKVEYAGEETVEGHPCYKIVLTTPQGTKRTSYYDQKSRLAVKSSGVEMTQQGEVEVETYVMDYKKVDGVLIPSKMRQKVLQNEIVIQFDKIEHNTELPSDRFDLPDEIKKLAAKETSPTKK